MANRITTLFDLDTKGFDGGLKKLRSEVAKADGAFGKLKVAGAGLGNILQANIASAAVAAGSALVAFGAKSVQAFQETALAAGRFADAAGVSVESASRLLEVSGDLGISGDAVQGAIQKMNKAIADGKPSIDGMADSIVRAKDGSVDSAATFENLVTRIGSIKDSTERAKVAQEVFGRSYGEIAQMMEMSAGELSARLNEVSDQKVIDEEERAKAERLRDAMDTLRDGVDDVMLAVGEGLVPVLADAGEIISNVSKLSFGLNDAWKKLTGNSLVDVLNPLDNMASGWNRLLGENVSMWDRVKGGVEIVGGAIPGVGEAISDLVGPAEDAEEALTNFVEAGTEEAGRLAEMYGERIPTAVETATTWVEDNASRMIDATAEAKREAEQLESKWASLFGQLDSEKALLDLQGQFDDLWVAGVEAFDAAKKGADDAYEKQNTYKQSLIDTKTEVANYGREVLKLPPEKVTKILAELDAGNAEKVRSQLEILSRNRTISLKIIAQGGMGYDVYDGMRANGGPVTAGKAYLVGEEGPELMVPNQSGVVIPNDQITGGTPVTAGGFGGGGAGTTSGAAPAASGGAPMIVNITTNADPEEVVRAIERYRRRNGSLPF